MMLTDPAIIRDALGFDDMTDINDAIEAALYAATQAIAARLNTSFDRAPHTDTWYVMEPLRHDNFLRQTEFRTRYGFVQSLDAISYGSEISHFGTSDATDASSSVTLQGEKGVIVDLKTDYTAKFVRAEYTYGFEADDDYPGVYDGTQVPTWLKEAAKLNALVLLANNPALDQADVTIDARTHQRTLEHILSQHARYTPLALLPL